MIFSYLLFTTPTCPNCPALKTYLSGRTDLSGTLIDATTPEGRFLASKFEIFAVPTVVFLDENDAEVSRAKSVGEIQTLVGPG
ncbi:MAG TPA: hypothetical protein VI874_02305 [Candidatus Norongarragalinales archaeon]|nr:hypothetical protein [Candidatus Norongarragalinales archaeon]